MGALVLAVLDRVVGCKLEFTGLFHRVLQLEQAMTTGGGWQDQIGGVLGGAKLITTRPGLVPEPDVQTLPDDVLCPVERGGQTLLYYTGITRLAKNILPRWWLATLTANRTRWQPSRHCGGSGRRRPGPCKAAISPRSAAASMPPGDLNKQLEPNCTNASIDAILERSRPHLYGAKLLGAGGGGFLLLVCRSLADALELHAGWEQPPES